MIIYCHLYDEIQNSNKIILQYKSDANISTLWISLRRYNYKCGFLLGFSLALSGAMFDEVQFSWTWVDLFGKQLIMIN